MTFSAKVYHFLAKYLCTHVQVTKIAENGAPVYFCRFTVQKIQTRELRYDQPKLYDVICHGIPFSGEKSMSRLIYNDEQKPRS